MTKNRNEMAVNVITCSNFTLVETFRPDDTKKQGIAGNQMHNNTISIVHQHCKY